MTGLNAGVDEQTILSHIRLIYELYYTREMRRIVNHIVKSKKLTYKQKFKQLKKTYLTLDIDRSGRITNWLRTYIILELRDMYEDDGIKIAGRLYNALINDKDILKKTKKKKQKIKRGGLNG